MLTLIRLWILLRILELGWEVMRSPTRFLPLEALVEPWYIVHALVSIAIRHTLRVRKTYIDLGT